MDKYFCENCNYKTNKSTNYIRHCNTQKHKNVIEHKIEYTENNKIYICNYCNKEYTKPNSIWYHVQKCKIIYNQMKQKNMENIKNIIEKVDEINEEIKTLNEKIDNVKPYTFNLNVFLNEHCKHAMSIDTFLSELQLKFTLDNTLEKDAIILLTNALKNMEYYKRPIHCLDLKRNKLCIKDNNEWTEDVKIFDKVPNYIANAYKYEIDKWEEQNYGFMNNSDKMSIFIQHMSKFGQVMNSLKILRPILKATTIPKKELKEMI